MNKHMTHPAESIANNMNNEQRIDKLIKSIYTLEQRTAAQEEQVSRLTKEIFDLIGNTNDVRTLITRVIYEEDISDSMKKALKEKVVDLEDQLKRQDKLMQFILNQGRNKDES